VGTDFFHKVGTVGLDRFNTYEKHVGNFVVGVTFCNEFQYLSFSGGGRLPYGYKIRLGAAP